MAKARHLRPQGDALMILHANLGPRPRQTGISRATGLLLVTLLAVALLSHGVAEGTHATTPSTRHLWLAAALPTPAVAESYGDTRAQPTPAVSPASVAGQVRESHAPGHPGGAAMLCGLVLLIGIVLLRSRPAAVLHLEPSAKSQHWGRGPPPVFVFTSPAHRFVVARC